MTSREKIGKILKEKVLLLDGAYGTEFIKRVNLNDDPPEILNINRPEVVLELQREYVEAGSDVLLTNTFGATPAKLSKFGLESFFSKIVRKGVRIAKAASKGKAFVFGDIGPTGELPYPVGDKRFEFFYENFFKQAQILVEEGVDGIILETFSDILELKAAVFAVRDVSKDVFLIAHLTFDENGRTLTGTNPAIFAQVFQDLDVDALGINCTLGPQELLPVFQDLASHTDKFLSVEPNAGMPIVKDGKTFYPVGPDEFASYVESYWESGVNIIGGCCGTSPEHIKKMRKILGNRRPAAIEKKKVFGISSPSNIVDFKDFVVVGERINPAGRKKLQKAIENSDVEYIFRDGKVQKESGADVLDVNFGVEQVVNDSFIKDVVMRLSYNLQVPLSLDIQSPEKLEVALRTYPARPLVNSVRASKEDKEKIRLLKKYGGMVVLLSMEEEVPRDFKDRVRAFEKGLELLASEGIKEDRIIVDPIVLSLGAGGDATETLKMIKYLSKKGFKSIVGLSNVSFGLPDRKYYNGAFLVLALQNGLSSAIMNPVDEVQMKLLNSALVVLKKKELPKKKVEEESILVKLLLKGDSEEVLKKIEKLHEDIKDPLEVVEKHLKPAMETIGELYDKGKIFLPQLILAAQTAKPAFDFLESKMERSATGRKRKVVIATVKGDVHDIGKNIVAAVMRSSGYEVIDLGKDVPSEKIIEKAIESGAFVIALSAMMTTTAPKISEVAQKLKDKQLNVPIIAGGASLNERLAKELGADYYAENASQGVKILRDLEEEK